tara:strand:+ start:2141 stop:2371 length:231 start_codon:yes stop_codon:yes gene_type:complete
MNDPNLSLNQPTPPFADFDNIPCDECGGITFTSVAVLKRVPALASPRGVEEIISVNTFKCATCSHINDKFLEGLTI